MRDQYLQKLNTLKQEVVLMGAMGENMLQAAIHAFETNDNDLASKIASSDDEIDNKYLEIEALCLSLILHQQPVASDLRLISASFKIITDLERIGDQACDIAEIALRLNYENNDNFKELSQMAKSSIKMLNKAIDAFVKLDVSLAQEVVSEDDIVDDHFLKMRARLIKLIENNDHEAKIPLDLMLIAKYLERIADHASNIAKWVIFTVSGHHSSGKII